MEEIKIKNNEPPVSRWELLDWQKRVLDMGINGFFVVAGALVLSDVVGMDDVITFVGILLFYVGVRFFPRWK